MMIRILNATNKQCIEHCEMGDMSLEQFVVWATKWGIDAKQIATLFKSHVEAPARNFEILLNVKLDWPTP